MITEPVYCTREDLAGALDFKQTARATQAIDRALQSGSRAVDGLCHRRFYPEQATRFFDWPNGQYARPWRLWLDASELISVDEVVSGGEVIDPATVLLEPNQYGPPFNQIQLDIGTTSGWIGASTHQRDIHITGLWGYRDDHTPAGTAGTLDDMLTVVTVDATASAHLGVGSLLRLDTERLQVTGRRLIDTGQTITSDVTPQNNTVTIPVADGTQFEAQETILIDGERMLIEDIAGNTLVVKRAWDGSTLAAHTAGATVYAPRLLAVRRAVLGSVAAAHSAGSVVEQWQPPALVHQLALAEAINTVLQENAGWFRSKGGSSSSSSEATLNALNSLRDQTYQAHGRKARLRGV